MSIPRNIVAIDLFCGAGGLTYGLRQGGIDVAAGIDADPTSQHAFETNNTASQFILKRVEDVTGADLELLWQGAGQRLLAGCAPCQPFSTYSQGKDGPNDNRWHLLDEYARLVAETIPDHVTMENVPSLATTAVFENFVATLQRHGYSIWHKVVDCRDYGLPQGRLRLVLLASRFPSQPLRLKKSHSTERSVRDAIAQLPTLVAGQRDPRDSVHRCAGLSAINLKRIRRSRPGGSWRDWPKVLRTACHRKETGDGYLAVYGRMRWEHPSPTLTTQCYNYGSGRFGHPEQDRPISLREAALLQGFPRNYSFEPKDKALATRDLARLIGNAVPPPLGRKIAQSLRRSAKPL
jgi:DNA (cytosine-5)-methyltransferase 1